MKSKLLLLAYASIGLLVLFGCGSSDSTSNATPPPVDTSKEVAGTDKPTGTLEVACFKGGYGIDFFQQAATEFEQKNPGFKIDLTGDPRIWEQLQPKFAAGDPPDLAYSGWGLNVWTLVRDDQVLPLDKALDGPPYDGKGTWRETFEPALLAQGEDGGHQYFLPYFFSVNGWWYDPGVFAANGWTVPNSFDDLLALCEKIKAKGIIPITYQGKYPYYMIEGMLLPWAYSVGGKQVVDDAYNLVPGAWKSPSMLQAAKMIMELQTKGDLDKKAVGLSHTESQTEFVTGKAAMIPCGTWLYSEMSKVTPPGSKMEFFNPPIVTGGKGNPANVMISIEPWMVPTKGKNPNAAIQFFKYLTSLDKAKQFVEQKGTLMAIKGSDQVNLPDVLKNPAKVFRDAKEVWSNQYINWYPDMEKEIEGAITSMLNGEITPEQFCDRAEAAAEKTRQDDSIIKHKLPS